MDILSLIICMVALVHACSLDYYGLALGVTFMEIPSMIEMGLAHPIKASYL